MIKYQYKQFLFLVLLLSSTLSYAEVSDRSIKTLLDLSGLTTSMNQIPETIKAGMAQAKQQGTSIPDAEYQLMLTSVDQSILPSEIIQTISTVLKNSINKKDVKKLLAWYESDLGKHITAEEEKASTPESYQRMIQAAPSLLENTERVAFAKKLDTLIGATDMAMNIQRHTSIAVYSAVFTAIRPNAPLNIEPIKQKMNATSTQTRAAIEQIITLSYVYSYQNLDTSTLSQYEDFLNEPSTIRFNKAVAEGINNALELSISTWAEAIAEIFKKKNQHI